MNQELIDYINKARAEGTPSSVIKVNLHMMGKWTEEEIDQSLSLPAAAVVPTQTPTQTPVPTPSVTPPVYASTPTSEQSLPNNPPVYRGGFKIAIGLLAILLFLGGAYVAYGKLGIFFSSTYAEDKFVSTLLAKFSQIESAVYTSSIELNVVPRVSKSKPLEEVNGLIYFLPPEMRIGIAFTGSADYRTTESSDWMFGLDASGDFGDLSYKINFEGVKKGDDLFLKVNNIPSFLFGELATHKGQWIKIGKDDREESLDIIGIDVAYLFESLGKEEELSSANKDKYESLIRAAASTADRERLFIFRNSPEKDSINGRSLTKYDLRIRKEAILPVYQVILDTVQNNPDLDLDHMVDPDTLEYLQSSKFDESFANLDQNSVISLWVDKSGLPAILEYKIGIIPPDDVTQFTNKQLDITLRIVFEDINKPVNIKAPSGAKTLREVFGVREKLSDDPSSYEAVSQRSDDARVKAQLSGLRASAEIYYDYNGSYGVTTNSCSLGMFADDISRMAQGVDPKNYPTGTIFSCRSNGNNYAVSASLANRKFWCIDSAGFTGEIESALMQGKTSCQ
jgi:hypothetical protein